MTEILEAGPELNARVAVDVMHLEDVRLGVMAYWFNPIGCGYKAEPYRTDEMHRLSKDGWVYKAREPYSGQQLQCHDSGYEAVPDYSTDWGAAGEVLEKLKQRGMYLGVWPGPDGYCIENYENGHDWVERIATAPLAICLAALEAVKKPE